MPTCSTETFSHLAVQKRHRSLFEILPMRHHRRASLLRAYYQQQCFALPIRSEAHALLGKVVSLSLGLLGATGDEIRIFCSRDHPGVIAELMNFVMQQMTYSNDKSLSRQQLLSV